MPSPREVALAHHAARQSTVDAASHVAAAAWARVDPVRIADSWAVRVPELSAIVSVAQLAAARPANAYLGEVLAAQGASTAADGAVVAGALAGRASDGRTLAGLLVNPVIVALSAIKQGYDVTKALAAGRANLDMMVRTQVADAGRLADQVAMVAHRGATGYVRVAVGATCSRCMVLAGRTYHVNEGFQRHPRCDCVHLPTAVAHAGGLHQDPRALYDRMTSVQRTTAGFSAADQLAIAHGADLGQVVNARRGMYVAGGRSLTTEGTTRRGLFGGYVIDPETGALRRRGRDELTRVPGQRVRVAREARLSVDQIIAQAGSDRDEALRLLRRNGYLRA